MFKRHASSNRKLIGRGAYVIAFAFPFISLFGETKASKIVSSENQFFVQNKQSKRLQFSHQLNPNKLNFNFDDFLISEGENQKDENTVVEEKRVLISEIVIEGLEDHPDKERLEVIAYDAMLIRPGSKVLSEEVKNIDVSLKEDLISSIDSKLEVTNKEIDKILTDRIEEVDNNFREELKAKILESKTQLQDQVNELKDSIPEVVEKEMESLGLSEAARCIDMLVRDRNIVDSNLKMHVKESIEEMMGEAEKFEKVLIQEGEGESSVNNEEKNEYTLGDFS